MYGLSVNQTVMGLTFSVFGTIIYVLVPSSMMSKHYGTAFELCILIYVAAAVALCLMALNYV